MYIKCKFNILRGFRIAWHYTSLITWGLITQTSVTQSPHKKADMTTNKV